MNTTDQEETPQTKTYGPYSPVRQAGDLYFISGHIGIDPATGIADPGVQKQTAQAFKNIARTLETAGLKLDDIVKTTLFLTDMDDFPVVNEVYVRHFAEPRPARSTVGAKELPRVGGATPLKIEIEAIAFRST